MEDMSTIGSVLGSKGVVFICFHDVQSGLVFVHGVQDDLEREREDTMSATATTE